MSYVDKCLWYDADDRYISTENEKEGWTGWDIQKVSIRHRASEKESDLVSIELWNKNGESQNEILLTRQNAMRLADVLKMAVIEFTVEDMLEQHRRRLEALENLREERSWILKKETN